MFAISRDTFAFAAEMADIAATFRFAAFIFWRLSADDTFDAIWF